MFPQIRSCGSLSGEVFLNIRYIKHRKNRYYSVFSVVNKKLTRRYRSIIKSFLILIIIIFHDRSRRFYYLLDRIVEDLDDAETHTDSQHYQQRIDKIISDQIKIECFPQNDQHNDVKKSITECFEHTKRQVFDIPDL